MFTDILGYMATIVTLLSFTVKEQHKLRLLNSTGACLWVLYGYLILSTPVIVTNVLILALNGRWLYIYWLETRRKS
jgi:uncharacterized protein with PQ loop repeat